jgi:hypothetical protein
MIRRGNPGDPMLEEELEDNYYADDPNKKAGDAQPTWEDEDDDGFDFGHGDQAI